MAGIKLIELWDMYSPLLTLNQREITDLHFNLDLTVSEIAEQKGISRQGVSECLSSAKKQLEEYERKLGFCRMRQISAFRRSLVSDEVNKWADELLSASPEFAEEIKKLKEILSFDYTAKAEELCDKPDKEN